MKKKCDGCNYGTEDSIEQIKKSGVQVVEGTWCYKNHVFVANTLSSQTAENCKHFIKIQQ